MSKALENLKETFSKSNLSPEDQNDLLVFLPILPEHVLEELNKIFEENPDLIEEFNANFKAKFNALTGQGDKSWDEIIAEEVRQMGELSEDDLENLDKDVNKS